MITATPIDRLPTNSERQRRPTSILYVLLALLVDLTVRACAAAVDEDSGWGTLAGILLAILTLGALSRVDLQDQGRLTPHYPPLVACLFFLGAVVIAVFVVGIRLSIEGVE